MERACREAMQSRPGRRFDRSEAAFAGINLKPIYVMSEIIIETTFSPLEINDRTRDILGRTVKWSKFIAVFCFVYCGLFIISGVTMCIVGAFIGDSLADLDGLTPSTIMIMGVLYTAMSVVYFFPALYLYNFSEKLPRALAENDIEAVNAALEYHRRYYKFTGIFIIAAIAVSILAVIGMFIFTFSTMAAGLA